MQVLQGFFLNINLGGNIMNNNLFKIAVFLCSLSLFSGTILAKPGAEEKSKKLSKPYNDQGAMIRHERIINEDLKNDKKLEKSKIDTQKYKDQKKIRSEILQVQVM